MSRPKIEPGSLGGATLLGLKPPEPVNIIVAGENGSKQIFPVVGVHLMTDAFRNMLGQLVCQAVEAVLTHHGLIQAPTDDDPEKASGEKPTAGVVEAVA